MVSTVKYITLMMRVISLVLGMQTTCDIRYDKKLEGLMADCNKRNLTSVPRDLPSNIVSLNLQENFITNLRFEPFSSFLKLKSLILSNNRIETLSKDSFFGLQELEVLDLTGNIFLDNGSYPRGIFDPVKNLKSVLLGGSVRPGFTFPAYIFLPLSKLTTLVITGAWPFLGNCTGFQSMRRLDNLYVQACIFHTIHNLQNDTFTCLRFLPLQSLTIRCIVNVIDVCVFCPLHNLTHVKIYTNFRSKITLKDATRSLYPFTKKNYIFKFIDFSHIQNTRSHDIDIVLNRQVMANLVGTCVERLDLSNNRLMAIKSDIIRPKDRFAKCIKYLDFAKNYIVFEFEMPFSFIFKYMINLKEFDFSQNSNRVSLGSYFCTTECSYNETITSIRPNTIGAFQISLPPKLKFLNLSNAGNSISFRYDVSVINAGNLQTMDISYNGYLESPARVSGLSNVTYLDISGMDIKESTLINTDMFRGVEILTAHDTTTFPSLLMSENSIFFLMNTKLNHLDLSGNDFIGINERTFSKLVNVHTLNLSRNRLNYVPHEILRMPSLTSLDLSFNSINVIRQPERHMLDVIREQQEGFTLNIYGNNFPCTCGTLDFVQWLHETNIVLGYKGNYSCLTEYGTTTFTTTFYYDLIIHWRRCVGQLWLTVSVSLQCFLIICLMSAFLLKKYFPKVEHHILQILGYKGKVAPKRCDFTYDAYVCYEDKRYQWPCLCLYQKLLQIDKGIKLYLPDLHESPGNSKAEATIDAISKSWKLIIVVTEDLFTDEWSYFTVLTAVRLFSQEEMITSRILLLYQDISPQAKAMVPRLLLNVVPEENILEVKSRVDDFLVKLHQMIFSINMGPEIAF